jgi:hypothetical protein
VGQAVKDIVWFRILAGGERTDRQAWRSGRRGIGDRRDGAVADSQSHQSTPERMGHVPLPWSLSFRKRRTAG